MHITYIKLWREMQKNKITYADMVKGCGISIVTLEKLKKDEELSKATLRKISKYIGCKPNDIYEFIDD